MKKGIAFLVLCFIIVSYGYIQVAFQNDLLAETMSSCCNNGQCNTAQCNKISGVRYIEDDCAVEVPLGTCYDCIDAIVDGDTSGWCQPITLSTYCYNEEGVKYYGDDVWETRTITFNNSSPVAGAWYDMGGSRYYPVTSDAFVYKSTQSHSARSVFRDGSDCYIFKEWSFGGSNNPTSYYVGSDATIYVIYELFDPAKYIDGQTKNKESQDQLLNSNINFDFVLYQNYPNPFNPETNIKYRVSSNKHVSLKIYDLLGIEISTIVNEQKPPGEYSFEFDAGNLPSGIYFYELIVGSFRDCKKMVLLE